jgi:hypothetical protein
MDSLLPCERLATFAQKGQLVVDQERLTDEGRAVFTLARQRALSESRPMKLDDMRHAAHIVALKRDKSSEHLTNKELDRVVCLFHVLEDPDLLGDDKRSGLMQWMAYERGEDPGAAKRVEWFIANAAPEEYTRAISQDKFGTRQWEWLTPAQKNDLAKTLSERRRAKLRPIQQQAAQQSLMTGTGPRVMALNPHKVFVKGPF